MSPKSSFLRSDISRLIRFRVVCVGLQYDERMRTEWLSRLRWTLMCSTAKAAETRSGLSRDRGGVTHFTFHTASKHLSSNNRYDPSNICIIDHSSSGKSQQFVIISYFVMFGESESESPRVPSPWDLVLAPASADKLCYRQDELLLPKLAAEVEEVGISSLVPINVIPDLCSG
jgi:hypothetical protein